MCKNGKNSQPVAGKFDKSIFFQFLAIMVTMDFCDFTHFHQELQKKAKEEISVIGKGGISVSGEGGDLCFRERRESLIQGKEGIYNLGKGGKSHSRSEQKVSKTTAGGDLLDVGSSLATNSHL